MNIAAYVKNHAKHNGNKTAIIHSNTKYTYKKIWSLIEGVCEILISKGVGKGDRVGLSMKDNPLHLIAHFSVAAIGGVIVPIDHRWTDKEKQNTSITFKIKLIITDQESPKNIKSITLKESDISEKFSPSHHIDLAYDKELLISLSSGTTGKPKGAILSHDNLYQRFESQWRSIGFDRNDCFALLTPLFFGAGRSFAMSMLVVGGMVEIAPPPHKPEEIIQILKKRYISATFLPPTLLRRLIPFSLSSKPMFSQLHYLIYSGEPLHSEEVLECLNKISSNLTGYYASSEGGGISLIKPKELREFSNTVGSPIHQTEIKIVDDTDSIVGKNEIGKLKYRGPGVATKFIDDKGNESSTDKDGGWFAPGDLAIMLPSGHIELVGRGDDVIIRGGINIYPNEIESILSKANEIKEVIVIGHKDGKFGEKIIAFVETTNDFDPKKVLDYCKEYLAPYKIPEKFIKMDSLPKKESGKIDKKQLKQSLISS